MSIQLYKTYCITFKVPYNEHVYEENAWPAYNDEGKLVWTLCKDDTTVISSDCLLDYTLLEIK